jgi:hypothetical protein
MFDSLDVLNAVVEINADLTPIIFLGGRKQKNRR